MHRTHFGPHFSEGARRLWMVLRQEGETPVWLKRELKASNGVVNRYLYGDRRPDLEMAFRIKDRFSIDPRLWLQPPARVFTLPAVVTARRVARAA